MAMRDLPQLLQELSFAIHSSTLYKDHAIVTTLEGFELRVSETNIGYSCGDGYFDSLEQLLQRHSPLFILEFNREVERKLLVFLESDH